jgi:hypothetical protein
MNELPATRSRVLWPSGTWPALLALAVGFAVIAPRAPIPIDETRYLVVFHESLRGSPLLLTLLGQPYAEKPPLLFWLGRALTWIAVPPDVALRCLPVLSQAATILVVDRLGRRLGLTLAGGLQGALLIGSLASQFLHFDPLVSISVWAAMRLRAARTAPSRPETRRRCSPGSGRVPLPDPVRGPRPCAPGARRRRRTALRFLIAWSAGGLGHLGSGDGGEVRARALWDRWAGRVAGETTTRAPCSSTCRS